MDKIKGMFKSSKGDPNLAGSIDFNAVLQDIGYWGKFHNIQLFLLFMVGFLETLGIVSFAFTGYLPEYRCTVPQCEDQQIANYFKYPVSHTNDTIDKDNLILDDYVQLAITDLDLGKHACKRITFDDDNDSCDTFMDKISRNDSSKKIVSCTKEELIFNHQYVDDSFSTHYGFVCGDFYLKGIFTAFVMGGMLIGSFASGFVSDRIGRKKTIAFLNILMAVAGFINAWNPPSVIYAICRIILGMASMGSYLCCFVILTESTLTK